MESFDKHVTGPGLAVDLGAEFYQRLIDADVAEALREFELPHVIVCFDPQTGNLTVEGPFEEGLAAIRMAEDDTIADRMRGTGFAYLVLPLLPRRDHDGQQRH